MTRTHLFHLRHHTPPAILQLSCTHFRVSPCSGILHALFHFSSLLPSYFRSPAGCSSAPLSVTYDSLQLLAGHVPRSSSSSFASPRLVVFVKHGEMVPANTTLAFQILGDLLAVSRSRTSAPRGSRKHSNDHLLFTLFEDVTRPCYERRQHHNRTLSWRPSFRDTRIAERETHTRVYLQHMYTRDCRTPTYTQHSFATCVRHNAIKSEGDTSAHTHTRAT